MPVCCTSITALQTPWNWSGNHSIKHVKHGSFLLFHLQVNDLPDFLRGKDRELCQHIRITYVTEKTAGRGRDWLRRGKREGLPTVAPPSRRSSHCPTITHTLEGKVECSPALKKEKGCFKMSKTEFLKTILCMWHCMEVAV